jgi:hypothetical protein
VGIIVCGLLGLWDTFRVLGLDNCQGIVKRSGPFTLSLNSLKRLKNVINIKERLGSMLAPSLHFAIKPLEAGMGASVRAAMRAGNCGLKLPNPKATAHNSRDGFYA